MLPQTYMRTQRTKRLYREIQTLAAASQLPVAASVAASAASSSSPSVSNSSSTPLFRRETRRGHYVVKRRWFLPHVPDLDDVRNYPNYYNEHERGDFHVYDLVRTTHEDRRPEIRVLMNSYVEGYGDIGDAISVTSDDARNYLIPAQLALYDTPENRDRLNRRRSELNLLDRVQRTPFAALTARDLEQRLTLPIVMNPEKPWKLEKFHVLVALRKVGVVVEDEGCVELPDFDVVEPRDVEIFVTVNATDRVKIKAKVVHWYVDLDGNIIHDVKEIWSKPKSKEKHWWADSAEPVTKIH